MVRWHHRLDGHEFEQTLRDGEGRGSLECCSPWGHKEWDTNEQLNNNNDSLGERKTMESRHNIQRHSSK